MVRQVDGARRWVAPVVGSPIPRAEVGFRCRRLRAVGPAAVVPAAVPEHAQHQLRRHDGAVRDGRDHRDRPQRRGGPDRSARPRLRRVLRRRRLHRRPADQPEQSLEQGRPRRLVQRGLGVAGVRAARDGHHSVERPDPGFTDAAPSRRLPGHRHAGLRRDHPAAGRQPRRRHQRPPRPQRGGLSAGGADRTVARRGLLQRELDGRRQLRHLVVLAGHRDDRRHSAVRRQPGTQPGRTGVGGHPRRRGRRRSDGRQHVQVQAVGVRDRRGHRRVVRSALCRPGAVRRATDVQHHQLDAVSLRRGARRAGQQAGRGVRRVHHRLPAEPPAGRASFSGSTSATSSICSSGWRSWR